MAVETGTTGGAAGGETSGATTGAVADTSATGGATEAGGAAQTGGAASGKVAEAVGEAAAAYTPNYKYKVLKEEKEVPDWARSIVKDQATEKQVRELFEKADGLPAVTAHRDQLIQENKQMREQWGPFVQDAQLALEAAKKGDLDSFFEKVGIPEVQILKYALHRLQLREKPEALAAHEKERQVAQELEQLRQENARLSSGLAETSVQARTRDLDAHVSRPEILATVHAFDARVGKPGAFRAEVIARGQLHAAQGRDITAEQAVSEVLQLIGYSGANTGAAAGNGAGAAGAAGGETQTPKPTLPNIRGKGTAPVKKVPRSTDELRQLAREKMLGA